MPDIHDKRETQRQWNANPCGAETASELPADSLAFFRKVERERYEVYAPWLGDAVTFDAFGGRRVLEIGPGLGTDHARFARAGAQMYGVDLTATHLAMTHRHFELEGLTTRLVRADAETLPFSNESFDVVYSFGVLHHTPDTRSAVEEIRRVLRPAGLAIVGLYHRHSAFYWVATMLCRGIRRGELWKRGHRRLLADIEHGARQSGAEPLVTVLSRRQCRRLFAGYSEVAIRTHHIAYSHFFPSRLPSVGASRLLAGRLAGRWGWYLIVHARK